MGLRLRVWGDVNRLYTLQPRALIALTPIPSK